MKARKLVGIELGIKNLRIAELDFAPKEKIHLKYYNVIPIPMLTLPGGEQTKERVIDWEILISKLKEEFKSRGYAQASVSVAIPQREANTVLITTPPVKGKDILSLLKREIQKTTTLEEGVDYHYAYLRLGERTEKERRVQNVLTVFAGKEKLINYFNNFLSTGITPGVITVRSFALYSLIVYLYPELMDAAIVDIGDDITSIVVLKSKQLKFVRSMYITFGELTDLLSKATNISFKEAKDFINKYGFDFDSYPETESAQRYKSYILNFLNRFRAELQRSLFYYQEKISSGEKVSKIYFTGSTLNITGLEKIFQGRFKLNVEILPYPETLVVDSAIENFKKDYYLFSSSIGCALMPLLRERINLIPKIQKEKISKNVYLSILILFSLIYGLIYYNYLGYKKKVSDFRAKLKRAKQENQSFPVNLDQVYKKTVQKRKEFSDLRKTFDTLQKPYINWNNLFREISKIIVPEVLLTNLKISFDEKGKLVVKMEGEYKGTFPDAQLILRKIRLAMEESKFFRDVTFNIQRFGEVKIGEKGRFPFVLSAFIEKSILKKKKL